MLEKDFPGTGLDAVSASLDGLAQSVVMAGVSADGSTGRTASAADGLFAIAAAINRLADSMDSLDHYICLGLRYGLYGTDAPAHTDLGAVISDAIENSKPDSAG